MILQEIVAYWWRVSSPREKIIFPLAMVTSIYVSYLAISISHRSGNAKKYEVASPEIVHTERRDNKIIVNYDGRDYVLMHNNELNRPELFPANRE